MAITVHTQGGLGNQMFQFAAGLEQASRLGCDLRINNKLNGFDTFRPFNLALFGLHEEVTQADEGAAHYIEQSLRYDSNIYNCQDGDHLVGYFQSEMYFPTVAPTLRSRFKPRAPWGWSQDGTPDNDLGFYNAVCAAGSNSVMLGIRRGDYVHKPAQAKFHGTMSYSYYIEALHLIRSTKMFNASPTIFVFSDDIQWVKENMPLHEQYETHYRVNDATVPGHIGREDIDLYLMSLCTHAVIANSSFHWWGAWLGDSRRQGVVVAPERWFLDEKAQSDSQDIIPQRWIKL